MSVTRATFQPRQVRSPAQIRIDNLVERRTREAVAYFESRRVPGITYSVSSTIDVNGSMVLTWTPEPS